MGVGLIGRTLGSARHRRHRRGGLPAGEALRDEASSPATSADPKPARARVRLVKLDELFREADVFSVGCPLNDETFTSSTPSGWP